MVYLVINTRITKTFYKWVVICINNSVQTDDAQDKAWYHDLSLRHIMMIIIAVAHLFLLRDKFIEACLSISSGLILLPV